MEYFSFTRQSNSDSFSNQHPCSRNLLCASTHWGKSPTNVDWVCPFSHVKWSHLAWRPRRQSDAFIVESLSMSMGCVKCATTCALWASYTYTKLDFFHLVFWLVIGRTSCAFHSNLSMWHSGFWRADSESLLHFFSSRHRPWARGLHFSLVDSWVSLINICTQQCKDNVDNFSSK